MPFDFWVPFGPAIRVPGLFGPQTIYPVWLVVLQSLVIVLTLLVFNTLKQVGWILKAVRDRDNRPVADEPTRLTTRSRPRSLLQELRRRHADEIEAIQFRKRWLYVGTLRLVPQQLTYLGSPTLVALTVTGLGTLAPLLVVGVIVWSTTVDRFHPLVVGRNVSARLVILWLWMLGLWWVGVLLHLLMAVSLVAWWYAGLTRDRLRTSVSIGESLWVIGIERDPPGNPGFTRTRTLDGIDLLVPRLDVGELARVIVAANHHGEALAYPAPGPLPPLPPADDESLGY